LGLEAGSVTLTGNTLNIVYSGTTFTLALDAGSFTVNGQAVSTVVNRVLNQSAGSFNVTGGDVNLYKGYILDAEAGVFALTGGDLNFSRDKTLTLEAGDFLITGGTLEIIDSGSLGVTTITFPYQEGPEDLDSVRRDPGEFGFNITSGKMWMVDDNYNLREVGGLYSGKNLRKSDPAVAGEFWNNNGTLSVSGG